MKLKFEFVNGCGVLVDEKEEIISGDLILWNGKVKTAIDTTYTHPSHKIIFAEKELGIDVPVFEWRDFEVENNPNIHDWVQEVILKEGKYWNDQDALEPVYYGIIKGYKSNPAKYTEEDLRKAISMARDYPTDVAGYQKDEIIKSLQKYPKYVVMESELVDSGNHGSGEIFHSNRIEEFTLFTNSEGKQQGIIKKLIWE